MLVKVGMLVEIGMLESRMLPVVLLPILTLPDLSSAPGGHCSVGALTGNPAP